MEKQEIFDKAKKSIVEADEEKALELISIAEKQGMDLLDLCCRSDEECDRFHIGNTRI